MLFAEGSRIMPIPDARARPSASGDGRRFAGALTATAVAAILLVGLTAMQTPSKSTTARYLTAVQLPISDATETVTFVLQDALVAERAGQDPQLDAALAAPSRLRDQLAQLAVPSDLRDLHERMLALANRMAADAAAAEQPSEQLAVTVRVQRGLREFALAVRSVEAIRALTAQDV